MFILCSYYVHIMFILCSYYVHNFIFIICSYLYVVVYWDTYITVGRDINLIISGQLKYDKLTYCAVMYYYLPIIYFNSDIVN